ncbi:MAG: sulfotransferase family protein [Pseudomonadota bacterium]
MTLSVIGAGLGRTGTMSLKLALERLGFGPCYHMVEVLDDPAGRSPQWEAAADGKPVDWDAIFKGYRSTVDWPGATFWREIVAAFPGAKVILTERDPEDWYRSIEQTIFSRRMPHDPKDPWARMTTKVVRGMFDGVVDDRDHAIAVFERHNRAVRKAIPADRLLVYEVSQGWEPLCAFLGVPVPDEPIPKTNSTAEFKERLEAILELTPRPD